MTDESKRWWWYKASRLTNPWWPPLWLGSDEWARRTIVFQVPGIGALVVALGKAAKGGPTSGV